MPSKPTLKSNPRNPFSSYFYLKSGKFTTTLCVNEFALEVFYKNKDPHENKEYSKAFFQNTLRDIGH